jgi:hypothetical protein
MTHWGDPVSGSNSVTSSTTQNPGMDKTTSMDAMAPNNAMSASKTVQ